MKLATTKRNAEKKGEKKRLRREGKIPAVVYRKGQAGEAIAVTQSEYEAIVRQVKSGYLSTQKFTLVGEDGVERTAILKEIQYHPTTYRVLHLDFEQLEANVPVNVKVPIECTGVIDCVGVKLGGVLRQVVRNLRVRCLPKDIPIGLTLNVQPLAINESRRLSALNIPEAVKPLADLKEVAVIIAKK